MSTAGSQAPVRLGVLGASGRMGARVCALVASEYAGRAAITAKPARGESLETLLDCDAVIDFSGPEAMTALSQAAQKHAGALPAFVVGSTGWKDSKPIDALAAKAALLASSNFSTGVLAVADILSSHAPLLEKLGYTPAIVETHHKHKKDAPSGTAILLQRAIDAKDPARVQTHAVRAGEIIGDHEVTFYGPSDHIVIGHFAQNRDLFARGAIDVALWLAKRRSKPGRVEIQDYFQELKAHV